MTKLSKSTLFGVVSIILFSITGIVVLTLHGDDVTTVTAFLLALVPPTIGALVGVRQNDRLLATQQEIKATVNGNLSRLLEIVADAQANTLTGDTPKTPETPEDGNHAD